MDWLHSIALGAGLAWASGIRLYAVLFLAGAMAHFGYLDLPPALEVLQHPLVLAASGVMTLGEFLADKVPAFDSVWDAVHTFIRIPAGAALAAGALGADNQAMTWIAALLGGSLAATSHATKMTARAAVNTSPEPFSNLLVSLTEDGLVVFLLWLSATHPLLFAVVLVVSVVLAVVLLVLLVKFLRTVVRGLGEFFRGRPLPRELG